MCLNLSQKVTPFLNQNESGIAKSESESTMNESESAKNELENSVFSDG